MMAAGHENTRALIIGGTQGLGQAIARRLVAEGCTQIVVTGRDAQKGEAAAADVRARFLQADLADTAATERMVDEAASTIGPINALVVAGASTDRGSIIDTDLETFDRMMTINLRSPYFAIQRVVRNAIDAGIPASIVTILTMSTHCGQSFLSPYSASKAALANVTKNAAQALRNKHIRVNGINCGWMDTPGEDAVQKRFHGADDNWLQQAEARQPFGMLVKPDHVAELAAYLLSSNSGVMTGSIIDFDQNVAGAYPE